MPLSVPPASVAEAVSATATGASLTLVMVVVAGVALGCRLSKFPPLAETMLADTLPGLPGAATLTEPDEAPAAIWMIAPLDSCTFTVDCAALVSVAV